MDQKTGKTENRKSRKAGEATLVKKRKQSSLPWTTGQTEKWKTGKTEKRKNGKTEKWKTGKMEKNWKLEKLKLSKSLI